MSSTFVCVKFCLLMFFVSASSAMTSANMSLCASNGTTFVTKLLTIGSFPDQLLLVSTDWFMYELPPTSLTTAQFNLSQVKKSFSLMDKWPRLKSALHAYQFSQAVFTSISNGNTLRRVLLLAEINATETNKTSVAFDVESGEMTIGNTTKLINGKWISSDENDTFYATFNGGIRRVTLGAGLSMQIDNDTLHLCPRPPTDADMQLKELSLSQENALAVNTTAPKGLYRKNQIFLFGADSVVIFNEMAALSNSSHSSCHRKQMTYEQFIKCGTALGHKQSVALIVAIMVAILALIIAVVVAMYCFCDFQSEMVHNSASPVEKNQLSVSTLCINPSKIEGSKAPSKLDSRFGKLDSQLLLDVDVGDPSKSDLDAIKTDQKKLEQELKKMEPKAPPTLRSAILLSKCKPKPKSNLSTLQWFHAVALKRAGASGRSIKSKRKPRIDVKPNTARLAPKNSHSDSLMVIAQPKSVKGKC